MKTTVSKLKSKKPSITSKKLWKWNAVLAVLHAVQAVTVLVLSTTRTLPVTTDYLTLDSLASRPDAPVLVTATRTVVDVNLAYLIVAFFVLSAIAHAIIATVYRKRYERDLALGINKARWFEYALSASTMIVAIGLLVGIADVSSLFMLFALTAIMNLLGLAMEVHNQGAKKPKWLTYNLGCVAGIVPWLVIAFYLYNGAVYGEPAPTFVYWIFVSIFVFFMSFAVNMVLQYLRVGKWRDYLYGEQVYMVLSLVAKSLLAWQVFAGTLRP